MGVQGETFAVDALLEAGGCVTFTDLPSLLSEGVRTAERLVLPAS